MRIGIDIVQPHPDGMVRRAQRPELARQIGHMRAHFAPVPLTRGVADVDAVSRCILADDQQLARPRRDQLFRLAQDCIGPPADQITAQRRDDAKGAAMVAPLGNLQIAVMARCQLQPAFGDQVQKGIGGNGGCLMHRADDFLILMRARDGEDIGEFGADDVGFLAHAPRHDDAAIFGQRLANRLQRFFLGRIEEPAGVDQHHIGARIVRRQGIAIAAQLGEDPLAVDQVLGTAKRYHADLRRGGEGRCHVRTAL